MRIKRHFMEPAHHISDSVVRFHRRHAFFTLMGFTLFVLFFILLVFNQYRLKNTHEKKILENNFADTVSHIDSLLASVTLSVERLKVAAEADLDESGRQDRIAPSQAFASLVFDASRNGYHMDTPSPPVERKNIGNLTGNGAIEDRPREFYREIHMALRLNPHFNTIYASLKNAAWVYYTSASEFITIYPWVDSKQLKFTHELYTHGFYSLGLPENNPDRRLFWTEVYVDEYGKGLMITCAAPVYDKDRFLGTVAIDLTVDFLNSTIKAPHWQRGMMFVVNEQEQLVAHSTSISSNDKRTKTFQEALSLMGQGFHLPAAGVPERQTLEVENRRMIKGRISNAPWHLFYMEPVKPVWNAILENTGMAEIALLLMMPSFIVVLLFVTNKYFIKPSQQFARFIMARSGHEPVTMKIDVPRVWSPWFEAVEKTFNENDALTGEIQRQNDELESRVKQRTAELANSNQKLNSQILERRQAEASLRESEAKYRRIFNSILDTYFEADMDGCILEISPSIETQTQFKREELIGKSVFDLYHDLEQIHQIHEEILRQEKISDREISLRDSDGTSHPYSLTAVIVRDEWGKPDKMIGSLRDIRDRRRVELEKKELEFRLQRAEKMEALGTLAGGVAHDLNNILCGIISYPELMLLDLGRDSHLRSPIMTIKKSGEKAAAIVQDMLTLARRGIAVREVIDINRLIGKYLDSPEFLEVKSRFPGIRFEVDLGREPLPLTGSAVHLSKTVMNLVHNAVEAIPGNGVVRIATQNRYVDLPIRGYDKVEQGDYVVVTVSDDGQGIPPEDLYKIFEPFYTKKKMGRSGTGLGMAVVWGTMRDHSGYIDVYSVPEHGTDVTLYFPASRDKVPEKPKTGSLNDLQGNETILVVDDVEEQRVLAKAMLSRLGYTVFTAPSGDQAIAIIKNNEVDLVILDMIMEPGMDGLDTYVQMMRIRPGQKAIITSGYSETDRVHEAQRLGAGAYVRKPYLMTHIGRAVRAELDR